MSNTVDQYVRFDKGMTAIVKAFAIIFMIILHGYGKNYDVPLDYSHSYLLPFRGSFKICVGMFTFMVGYGYAFSKTKDWRYSLLHIKKLIIPFWTILFVFSFPVCWEFIKESDATTIVYNLFGVTDRNPSPFLCYGWFVYFFIYAMIAMPFLSRFIDKSPIRYSVISIVVLFSLEVVLHELPRFLGLFNIIIPHIVDTDLPLALFNCLLMSPIMILGYLFAYEGYFERINLFSVPKVLVLFVCVITMIAIIVLRQFTYSDHNPFNLDFFYAPLMIGAIVVLFNKFEWKPVRAVLTKMGEVSVYMWFFHALFFTQAVKWFYQPSITIFSDINLVVLWAIVLTFFASWLIKAVVDRIVKCLS